MFLGLYFLEGLFILFFVFIDSFFEVWEVRRGGRR